MNLDNKHKVQPLIGLGVLLIVVIFGAFKSTIDQNLGLYLVTGLALGYILTRSRFGFAGGIKRIYVTGERSLSSALLVMFAIAMILAAGIQWSATVSGLPVPGLSFVKFLNISVLIGGFIFGMGMMLAGGCASGTLSDLGEGEGHAMFAIITFILGSIPGVIVQDQINSSAIGQIGIKLYLPDAFGYVGALAISFVLLVGLYVIVRKYEDYRKKEGYYQETVYEDQELPIPEDDHFKLFSYKTFHKFFVERWSFMTGGILLAIMFALILITTNNSWGITGAFVTWGVAFLQMLGVNFTAPVFAYYVETANKGILNDPYSLRNIGIILGALIGFLLAGRLAFKLKFKLRNIIYYLIGGFLMGFGARLAGGCNIGALFSGICNFSISGWGFFVTLTLGGMTALKLFAGKADTIPPDRHQKIS
ncbi:YeeE/YedE family protein [Acetobacterium woodii]|uniref:Putative membrane protein n=1 Tax=Acetobacterium woodii (strain ATCC 29683 / DSM 1030 / JCM 2381 / KCTC 1655 / WB1) TaxID=931626 RepID=H6LC59_ACEWD|nr:YeeE/YedE family protein [Acetobacterium woodii]AFA49007.1 putative membrane protein [Acetobacterium woodii DSM 1030]